MWRFILVLFLCCICCLFSDSCSANLYFSLILVPPAYLHLTPPMPTQHKFGSSLCNAISLTSLSTFSYLFPLETMMIGLMLDYFLMLFITHIQSVSSEFIFFFMFHHAIASELQKYSQMQLFLSHILRWIKLLSWFICSVSSSWSSCLILLWGTS